MGERNVRYVMQVVTGTLKTVVLRHAKVHVEGSVRSATGTGGSAVVQSHRRAVFDARGNVDR